MGSKDYSRFSRWIEMSRDEHGKPSFWKAAGYAIGSGVINPADYAMLAVFCRDEERKAEARERQSVLEQQERTEWHSEVESGDDYGIDPEDYDTEEEYKEALYEEKYEWREYCTDNDHDIDPEDYETEEEYEEAVEEAKYGWREDVRYESDVDPWDYETLEEYKEAVYQAKYEWRELAYNEYDIDPEDYETEEEYEDAVEEAEDEAERGWRAVAEDKFTYGLDPRKYRSKQAFYRALEKRRAKYEDAFRDNSKWWWINRINEAEQRGVDVRDYESEADYLNAVWGSGNRQSGTRASGSIKKDWRDSCVDGSPYGVDPQDYDSQGEYEKALEDAVERIWWRYTRKDGEAYGIDPEQYSTEKEYDLALEKERMARADAGKTEKEEPEWLHADIDPEFLTWYRRIIKRWGLTCDPDTEAAIYQAQKLWYEEYVKNELHPAVARFKVTKRIENEYWLLSAGFRCYLDAIKLLEEHMMTVDLVYDGVVRRVDVIRYLYMDDRWTEKLGQYFDKQWDADWRMLKSFCFRRAARALIMYQTYRLLLISEYEDKMLRKIVDLKLKAYKLTLDGIEKEEAEKRKKRLETIWCKG